MGTLFFGYDADADAAGAAGKEYVDAAVAAATSDSDLRFAAYVRKTDHMKGMATGDISMGSYVIAHAATATGASHVANKKYVDDSTVGFIDNAAGDSRYVKKTEHLKGTATGNISMGSHTLYSRGPTANAHVATKEYVDNQTATRVKKTDHMRGTATGNISMGNYIMTHSAAPTSVAHVANRKYVDDNFVGDSDFPSKLSTEADPRYVRQVDHMKGAATGSISMGSGFSITQTTAPTNVSHLVNKKYVDDNFVSRVGGASGATLTATWYYEHSGLTNGSPRPAQNGWNGVMFGMIPMARTSTVRIEMHVIVDNGSGAIDDAVVNYDLVYISATGSRITKSNIGGTHTVGTTQSSFGRMVDIHVNNREHLLSTLLSPGDADPVAGCVYARYASWIGNQSYVVATVRG